MFTKEVEKLNCNHIIKELEAYIHKELYFYFHPQMFNKISQPRNGMYIYVLSS